MTMLWPERKQERPRWGWSAHGQCGAKADRAASRARRPSRRSWSARRRGVGLAAVDHGGGGTAARAWLRSKARRAVKIPLSVKALCAAAGRGSPPPRSPTAASPAGAQTNGSSGGRAKGRAVAQPAGRRWRRGGRVRRGLCGGGPRDGSVQRGVPLRPGDGARGRWRDGRGCAAGDHHALLLDRAGPGLVGAGGDGPPRPRRRRRGAGPRPRAAARASPRSRRGGLVGGDRRPGRVVDLGLQRSGQLGLGDRDDRDRPVIVLRPVPRWRWARTTPWPWTPTARSGPGARPRGPPRERRARRVADALARGGRRGGARRGRRRPFVGVGRREGAARVPGEQSRGRWPRATASMRPPPRPRWPPGPATPPRRRCARRTPPPTGPTTA